MRITCLSSITEGPAGGGGVQGKEGECYFLLNLKKKPINECTFLLMVAGLRVWGLSVGF